MVREGLCDLEDRPFKAAIGYHQALEARKRPFIFGQVYTIQDVVSTVFHEAGHAFHAFEMARLPYCWQRRDVFLPLEFAEVASTTMELLGSMYLHRCGLCTPAEEANLRAQHLDRFVTQLFLLTARGDAFQQWVYDDVERASDLDACDQCWIELSARYLPDIDWTGLEVEQRAEWLQVRHFFGWPFYYIEYALAALGAWQIVENYLADPGPAVDQFRGALALGATRSIPELFSEAGTVFGFDARLVGRVLDIINRVRAGL
jgi:oligoendopeptidase F